MQGGHGGVLDHLAQWVVDEARDKLGEQGLQQVGFAIVNSRKPVVPEPCPDALPALACAYIICLPASSVQVYHRTHDDGELAEPHRYMGFLNHPVCAHAVCRAA